MTTCCRKSATITHFNGTQLSCSLVIFAQGTRTVIYETGGWRKPAPASTPEDISNFCSVLRLGFVDAVSAMFLMETFSECNTEVFNNDHWFFLVCEHWTDLMGSC